MIRALTSASVWKRRVSAFAYGLFAFVAVLVVAAPADAQCTAAPDKFAIVNTGGGCPTCAEDQPIGFAATPTGYTVQSCDQFHWSFGDGTTSTQQNPTKTYANAGDWPVILTVKNTKGMYEIRKTVSVTSYIPNCDPPTGTGLMFTGATSGCNGGSNCVRGESINFQGFTSKWQGCDVFTWNMGDGSALKAGREISHTYSATGKYSVHLTVTNGNGGRDEKFYDVYVTATGGNQTPTGVDFSLSKTRPIINEPVTLTATSSLADATYNWYFDADNVVDATGKVVNKTFTQTGTYQVQVQACNGRFCSGPTQKPVTVVANNEFAFLLPAVAHLENAGPGGAIVDKWLTDLHIYNNDPAFDPNAPLLLTFEFQGISKEIAVDKSTVVFKDLLRHLTNQNTYGAVVVRGNSPYIPKMWTRTYTEASDGSGTYGQLIPAVNLNGTRSNETGSDSLQYISGMWSDSRFRTNLGIVNPTEATANVSVALRDADGFPLAATFNVQVPPFSLRQINDGQLRTLAGGSLPGNAPFAVELNRGDGRQVVAYASLVDRVSNDPVYIQSISDSQSAITTRGTQVLPGISHFDSTPTSKWASDVSILNPDSGPLRFNLEFYDASGSKVAEAKDLRLFAKASMQLDDVLRASQFTPALTGSNNGTLRLVTTTPGISRFPIVSARTYFQTTGEGSFGQGLSGFSPEEANLKTGGTVYLPGVISDELFYTNLGLVSLSDQPTVVAVELLSQTTGSVIAGPIQYTLAPRQSRIFGSANADFLKSLSPTAQVGSLRLRIISGGNVWAFASVIDRQTKDPEYVPANQ